jgi:transposase
MPRLRQNDREQGVGMVQAGMTHQALADHFNVSRITIPMLMIRLRQTDRTNDKPHNGRPHVMPHNTSVSKTVELVHTLVRKTFPTAAVHTITSIAKTK